MSNPVADAPQKVNLRRPDIMEAVQAQVLSHYRSELVERIRANGHMLSAGDLTIKLAKEFGFCYGVERAIDLAYAARRGLSRTAAFFCSGEIIHNPEVNDQIRRMGISLHLRQTPEKNEINPTRPGRHRDHSGFRHGGGDPAASWRPRAAASWTRPAAT